VDWNLASCTAIEATITNDGTEPTEVGLWVVADRVNDRLD
jgi:hypothetical protein